MVKIIQNQDTLDALSTSKELYQCDECGFFYKDREWADRCEAWCKEHKSCNLEITKHAEKN